MARERESGSNLFFSRTVVVAVQEQTLSLPTDDQERAFIHGRQRSQSGRQREREGTVWSSVVFFRCSCSYSRPGPSATSDAWRRVRAARQPAREEDRPAEKIAQPKKAEKMPAYASMNTGRKFSIKLNNLSRRRRIWFILMMDDDRGELFLAGASVRCSRATSTA